MTISLPASASVPRRILIVGGVAGGASTAARARRLCGACQIVMVERGPHVSFANCGLPYFAGGEIPDEDDLLVQTPQSLAARLNLDVRVNSEVLSINRTAKTVHIRDGATGNEYEEPYDTLVLATGAVPLQPAIPGIARDGHFLVRNIPDAVRIKSWADSADGSSRVVVVGGGYIGLEMAEQLRLKGLSVTVVEAQPQVMAPMDPELAALLHVELRHHGVELILNDAVQSFGDPGPDEAARASVVVLRSGRRLPADAVIMGLGVKPETSLARQAGLEIGGRGGIRVNAQMQTNDPSIYAVGDVVEVRDGITGQWTLIPLAGPANRQGRMAADAIFGKSPHYSGTWGTAILRLFRLTAACTGANSATLMRCGMAFETVHLHPRSHAGYYPGASGISMKIMFDPKTGRLLGAQAVGRDGVDKRIDVLATALKSGLTVHDLADLELCYAPPFGSAKDPVNLAGMIAQNVLSGEVVQRQWHEIEDLNSDHVLLVDVRDDEEYQSGCIPGAVSLPLNELRSRLGELPEGREMLVYCQSGQRSYLASRLLGQHGFRVRNLSGGYRTWQDAHAI